MQGAAWFVPGEYMRLQGPVSFLLRNGVKAAEQCRADSSALCLRADVDADLSDTGGASIVWNRGQRGPAQNTAVRFTSNGAADDQVPVVPHLPDRRCDHESREAGHQPLAVDCPDLDPIPALHLIDNEVQSVRPFDFREISVASLIETSVRYNVAA